LFSTLPLFFPSTLLFLPTTLLFLKTPLPFSQCVFQLFDSLLHAVSKETCPDFLIVLVVESEMLLWRQRANVAERANAAWSPDVSGGHGRWPKEVI